MRWRHNAPGRKAAAEDPEGPFVASAMACSRASPCLIHLTAPARIGRLADLGSLNRQR